MSPERAPQDVQTAWQQLQGNALLQGIQTQAHEVPPRWVLARKSYASADLAEVHKGNGRYAGWAYDQSASYASLFDNVPADVLGRVGFVADDSLSVRGALGTGQHFAMPDDMKKGRDTAHNTNENAPWVRTARQNGAALSAGPSATTSNVMALAVTVGASQDELNGLAWGLFAIWNIMPMHKSGTHRFHEVMGVAQRYNVPYQQFVLPNAVPDTDFQPAQTQS